MGSFKEIHDDAGVRSVAVVWRANRKGYKRFFGRTELTLTNDSLLIGKRTKLPIDSILSVDQAVEPLDPSFSITWKDPRNGRLKKRAFCCPTVKGYNRSARTHIINTIRSHIDEQHA